MLVKEGIQRVPLDVRYVGFGIGPQFVIGYGSTTPAAIAIFLTSQSWMSNTLTRRQAAG